MTEQVTTEPGVRKRDAVGVDIAGDELSIDAFLGGRLLIAQPKRGYRAGIDAVLLAAAASLEGIANPRVLDCGAGVGTVGLCLASCNETAEVVLLERDRNMLKLAKRNIADNNLSDRVNGVACDVTSPGLTLTDAGIHDNSFTHIVANPPFFDTGAGTRSPHALKAAGHAMPPGDLAAWIKFAARMASATGRLFMIQHSATLPAILDALGGRFGSTQVVPIYARDGQPANRILISALKGSRAPFTILPGLILHDNQGRYTPAIEAVLRRGAPLAIF